MRARHRRAHLLIWRALAIILPLLLLAAVGGRQIVPAGPAPVLLSAPR